MSHELRTPLNGILGYLQLAEGNLADPQLPQWLQLSHEAAGHLATIIDELMDVSRMTGGRLAFKEVPVDLVSVISTAAQMTRPLIEAKDLEFVVNVDPALGHRGTICDPKRLSQVLINLLTNASKFTAKGGVMLEASLSEIKKDGIELLLSVRDTGVGMEQKVLKQALERARSRGAIQVLELEDLQPQRGLGLGLSIVCSIVEAMGGTLSATSEPGEGSEFVVRIPLPRATDPGEKKLPVASDVAELSVGTRKGCSGTSVLIAEDDPISRMLLEEMLQKLELQVDSSVDGEEAVAMASQQRYALVLLDLWMPKLDGLEAARQIRQLDGYDEVPLIAVTANVFPEDRMRSLNAGFDEHIGKPVTFGVLCGIVKKHLQSVKGN